MQLSTSFRLLDQKPFARADTKGYAAWFERGAYALELRRPSYFAWEPLADGEPFSDFALEAEIESDPANGYAAVGLLFRHSNDENYYSVFASNRGLWRLDRVFNNHPLPLVGWTGLPEPRGESRMLRVVASRTRITVVVDDEWVGEVEDDGLVSGAVCLAAQNYDEKPRALFRLRRFSIDARPMEVQRQHLRWSYYFPVQPSARLLLAESFMALGAVQAAAVQIAKALKGRQGTAREHLFFSDCLLRLGDRERALAEVEAALSLEPENPDARLGKANALYLANRFLEVRDWLAGQLAEPAFATRPAAWNLLGNAEYSLGNFRRAADAYLRAVDLEPGSPLVLRNAARALELADDRTAALRNYLEAGRLLWREEAYDELTLIAPRVLALDPSNREVKELEAKALFCEGRKEEAGRQITALIEAGSTDSGLHFLLGVLHAEKGERDRALPAFERAAGLEPDFALYHLRLAETLHLLGRDCSAPLARARELSPHDPWVSNLEGQLALEAGDAAKAARLFRAAAERAPREPDILINLSEALAATGELGQALAALAPGDGPAPDNVAARLANQRGNLLGEAGEHAEAARAYEEAIRLDSGEPVYQENCAGACIEADLISRAEELLSRLAQEHPSPSVYNLIGNVASLRGERHRAELAWATGLSLDPQNPDIQANLAAQHLERGSWERAKELVQGVLADHPDHPHASRLSARIRKDYERSLACSGCGRTWWVPRELPPQPSLTVRGEPPGDAPAGRCVSCGLIYCVSCASRRVVESRLTCEACGGQLKLSDDALRWLLSSRLRS